MTYPSKPTKIKRMTSRLNGLSIVAFTLLIFAVFAILMDIRETNEPLTAIAAPITITATPGNTPYQPVRLAEPTATPTALPTAPPEETNRANLFSIIRLPYDSYTLTQGPHGFTYGDAAIDLTAGNGAAILSPIYGVVTKNGYDEWGNTALIIENDQWQVKLLHGDYFPKEGDWVTFGHVVGKESNHGNTEDIYGVSCKGRNCGYHTHLNVFDKSSGKNADLMELLHP